MKNKLVKLRSGLAAACATLPLLAGTNAAGDLPQDFPHVVQYELGDSEFAPGDSITIEELRGTAEDIRLGGTYCVMGSYTLNTEAEATLAFNVTTTNPISTTEYPEQMLQITKGAGSFRLIKRMEDPGYLHLTFYSAGQGIGGVYFGQDPWVLRHKHWSYRGSAPRPEKPEIREPVSATGPNQALFEYLGNPVAPPADLDAAYTKDGLTRAMQAAANNAGITLVKLEIDDSEFPCLVGVVCANRADMEKLKDQIRTMTAYNYTGGVGGNDRYAMNLVPFSAFPAETRRRIYHREMLREEIFFNKMNGME